MRPSFIGQTFNIFFLLVAAIMFYMYYKELSHEAIIKIFLLISIAIGIHAILHHYEEIYYDFNPLVGKWNFRDNKI